jgi:uncharacterized membrane protein YgcG
MNTVVVVIVVVVIVVVVVVVAVVVLVIIVAFFAVIILTDIITRRTTEKYRWLSRIGSIERNLVRHKGALKGYGGKGGSGGWIKGNRIRKI